MSCKKGFHNFIMKMDSCGNFYFICNICKKVTYNIIMDR